jgi:hypothetical protein
LPIFNPDIVKFGKSPANIPSNLKMLTSHFREVLPDPPETVTWSKGVTSFGEMLNDKLGDCTCAAVGHMFQIFTLNESREWTATDNDVLHLYETADGYDPNAPLVNPTGQEGADGYDPNAALVNPTDQGGNCGDVLNYITKNPFMGWTLVGYGLVNWTHTKAVKQAIWKFGAVYLGINLPKSAQNQAVWDIVDESLSGDSAPNSWGGHCIVAVDFDADYVTVITWGMLQKMTWAFWNAYVDEAYAVFASAWIMHDHVNPLGFSKASLEDNMKTIMNA